MNEDEAFIRAIVDSPGDDTPRLVYADWLDDRADPRGPYLRAECEWAGSGRKEKALRTRAAPLDPVWVARVSRPPVGVCCGHLARTFIGRRAEPSDLDAAEAELGVVLPPQLRAVLLNYGLGRLRGSLVLPEAEGRVELALDEFVCLTDPDFNDDTVSCELVDRTIYDRDEWDLSERFVFLAGNRGYEDDFVVSCRGRDRGAVYLKENGGLLPDPADELTPLAASIGEFLALLAPSGELTDQGS
ncbi:MAG TPA: TIGR02996 domain-containing protein [Gemmata sp.]